MTFQLDCTCCLPRMASPAGRFSENQMGSSEASAGRGLWSPAKGCPVLTPFEVSGWGWEVLATSKASFIELEILTSLKCHDTAAGAAQQMLIGAPGLEGGPRGWIAVGLVLGLVWWRCQPSPSLLPGPLPLLQLCLVTYPGTLNSLRALHQEVSGRGCACFLWDLGLHRVGGCALPETGRQGHQLGKWFGQIYES